MKIDSVVKALMQWGKDGHKVEVKLTTQPDGTLSILARGDSHPNHPDWTSGFSSDARITHPDEFAEKLFQALNPSDPCHGRSNMDIHTHLCDHLDYMLKEVRPDDLEANFLIEKKPSTAYHLIGLVLHNRKDSSQNASFSLSMALQGSHSGMNMTRWALQCLKEQDIRYEYFVMDNDRIDELLKNPTRFNEYVTCYGIYLDHIDESHPLWDSSWWEIKGNLKKLKKEPA